MCTPQGFLLTCLTCGCLPIYSTLRKFLLEINILEEKMCNNQLFQDIVRFRGFFKVCQFIFNSLNDIYCF